MSSLLRTRLALLRISFHKIPTYSWQAWTSILSLPNIPLEETIDICVDTLFEDCNTFNGLSKSDFHQLLSLATKESLFIFDGDCYKQISMVSPWDLH